MLYKKIDVELIVVAEEADAVVAELNAALDLMEERHTLFGGGIEITAFDHSGTRRDRHSPIRSVQARLSLLLSGLHVRASLRPSVQLSDLDRPTKGLRQRRRTVL